MLDDRSRDILYQRWLAEDKAEKIKRDQELNRQQQEKAEQKARAAQIKQLICAARVKTAVLRWQCCRC